MVVTLLLTNGLPRKVNIVDDTNWQPHFALQWCGDPGLWLGDLAKQKRVFLEPGTNTLSLGDCANGLKLFLAPQQCLTNTVVLTNPPPRFRLKASVRDLEKHVSSGKFLVNLSRVTHGAFERFFGKVNLEGELQEPITPWIDTRR